MKAQPLIIGLLSVALFFCCNKNTKRQKETRELQNIE